MTNEDYLLNIEEGAYLLGMSDALTTGGLSQSSRSLKARVTFPDTSRLPLSAANNAPQRRYNMG